MLRVFMHVSAGCKLYESWLLSRKLHNSIASVSKKVDALYQVAAMLTCKHNQLCTRLARRGGEWLNCYRAEPGACLCGRHIYNNKNRHQQWKKH